MGKAFTSQFFWRVKRKIFNTTETRILFFLIYDLFLSSKSCLYCTFPVLHAFPFIFEFLTRLVLSIEMDKASTTKITNEDILRSVARIYSCLAFDNMERSQK